MPSRKLKTSATSQAGRSKTRPGSAAVTKSAGVQRANTKRRRTMKLKHHVLFFPLITLTLILWVVYRSMLPFPVWFDEIVAKAIFFGFPVWIYITVSRSESIPDTFAPGLMQPGLLLGVAVGGIFGFVSSILGILQGGGLVQAAPLFAANTFWWEFFLAMMTGFWETLFFFSFIMTVIMERFNKWSLLTQVVMTSLIFTVFHLPNAVLRFSEYGWPLLVSQAVLLFFFAMGQSFLFSRWRNFYALVMSHAIWGMVLLVHINRGI